jgi:hypothetical protein
VDAGQALDPTLLTGNSGSGNVAQSFGLAGALTSSTSLADIVPSGWTPVIARFPYHQYYGPALGVGPGVTLTVPAGTVVKSAGQAIGVAGGSLVANGTAASPVVFTSIYDGSVGGATDTSTTPVAGSWSGIRLEHPLGYDTIDHVVLKYASSAIAVSNLAILSVNNSEFVHNIHAFTIDKTDGSVNDPALSAAIAALPCVPPYTTFVNGVDNWFGPGDSTGLPGLDTNIADDIGALLPPPFDVIWAFQQSVTLMFKDLPDTQIGENTIPVSLYSCGFVVPMFPVNIAPTLPNEPFPAWSG